MSSPTAETAARRDIIVIGGSAGALSPLQQIVQDLPHDLPAAVFIVLHVSSHARSNLPEILSAKTSLKVIHPASGTPIQNSTIYVAPPNHHLKLRDGQIELGRGPRENRQRPSIDKLFRSAAIEYGPRVIGVLLSGLLDDGTVGLYEIKERGGVALVQDPAEADQPSMLLSAVDQVDIDYQLPATEIGKVIVSLTRETVESTGYPQPEQIMPQKKGHPAPFSCPDCNGPLWESRKGNTFSYECRIGHTFSPLSFIEGQSDAAEQALWGALQEVEQKAAILQYLSKTGAIKSTVSPEHLAEALRHTEMLAESLRRMIHPEGHQTPSLVAQSADEEP